MTVAKNISLGGWYPRVLFKIPSQNANNSFITLSQVCYCKPMFQTLLAQVILLNEVEHVAVIRLVHFKECLKSRYRLLATFCQMVVTWLCSIYHSGTKIISLTPPLFLEVPVSRQESEHSSICVRGIHSVILVLDFGIVPTVW